MPVEGWAAYLAQRGISFRSDHLGRNSVTAHAAKMLLDERREAELKTKRRLAVVEAEQVEADRQWRASLPKGLPAGAIPEGASYADLIRQAEKDAQPRRRSMIEESLAGETLTFHSYQDEGA